ncbi:hypothetical protein D3C87_482790 [compost metagenome]
MVALRKPKVGTWVRVRTDYSEAKKAFHWVVQRKYETVGKVVESQEWEGENTFALLTDDPKMRIKTIDLKWVTSIEQIKAQSLHEETNGRFKALMVEEKAAARTFEIKGSKGNTYFVTKDKFSWSCTCEAGQRGRRCKHVAEAETKLKAEKV